VVQTSGAGQFGAEKKLADGADMIYINGNSFISNARSLEPLFKSRMFAGVQS
jgi:adenine-specific DNA-methyltransferase